MSTWDDGAWDTTESRYFISSCSFDVDVVARCRPRALGYGEQLYWVLDVTCREDESRIRRGHDAEKMSVLRRLTLNLLKRDQISKASLHSKRKIAIMDDSFRTQLISGS